MTRYRESINNFSLLNKRSWWHGIPTLSLLLVLFPAVMFGAENSLEDDNQSNFYKAQALYLKGSYAAAAQFFALVDDIDERAAVIGASRSLALIGEYEEAMEVCEEAITQYADYPLISTQLAEVKRSVGRSSEAVEILEQVIGLDNADSVPDLSFVPVRALVQYGSLLKFLGRRDEAGQFLESAIYRYDDGLVFESEEVAMIALASWLLDRFHDANSLFSEATRANPNDLEAQTLWGDLFNEKFNVPDAERSYTAVLEINRRYTPAMVGLAEITGNERLLRSALDINPRYVPALEALGFSMLRTNRKEHGYESLNQALEINPQALVALSMLASQAALVEDMQTYDRYLQQVESFSPNNPEFFADISDTYGKNYRFVEAVEFARKSIAADSNYWQGHTLLGTNLIRLGEEEEGRGHLEFAFDNDPFNVMTSNMLKVFDTLDTYATRETEHFKVHLSPRDAVVLWPYLSTLLEEAWDTLTRKYDFVPEGPILIEIFENSEDFAVRSVGLPDIGPLVGICFGKVITLISPDELSANWQEIVWHEFVHIITLQMTKNRMPRWLSEGISVWEEQEARPEWGRRQGIELVRAAKQNKLLPVGDLNEGFSGANSSADLGFAYFESYLVVDYIAKQYGFEKLLELVKQYGTFKEENDMFVDVFDLSLEKFDEDFQAWIAQRVEEIGVYVHREDVPDEGEGHGHGVRSNSSAILAELYNNSSLKQHMRQRITEQANDFQAHLQLGILLFKEESYSEAKSYLHQAHELLPDYSGFPSPPLVLSQIYEKEGNREEQLQQLEILVNNQQHDYESVMILANDALDREDFSKASYYVERALGIDPYRMDVHRLNARLAELTDSLEVAVTEYQVLVELDVSDPVEAKTDLAQAYLNNGQREQARINILSALEIAPSYRRAQKVLLQAVELN